MPDSIVTLASALLKNPVKITITPESPTVDAIEQFVYFVEKAEKGRLLISLLRKAENQSVLVFSRTKHNADRIGQSRNRKSGYSRKQESSCPSVGFRKF